MAESHQQPSSTSNDNADPGVGNSVVSDLMRVYENLTQSSTPQAEMSDASKALSLAYTKNMAPQHTTASMHHPASRYPIPTNVFQQQQEIAVNNPLHRKLETGSQAIPPPNSKIVGGGGPNMTAFQHQQHPAGNSGYVPGAGSVPDSMDGSHHTQRSGEDPHAIVRTTSSVASRTSQVSSPNVQQPPADASSESDKSTSGGRSKKKRKQSQNEAGSTTGNGGGKKSGRGKKSKKEDGRWSKRFTWPEDLHRDFVSAIFDVGLKHSSPSTIMEHMPKHEQITSERIKSHLQKYRLHRVKSKKEFISSYEASLRNFQNQNSSSNTLVSGNGEVAAHLTTSSLGNSKGSSAMDSKEGAAKNAPTTVSSSDPNKNHQQLHHSQNISDSKDDSLLLPQLTEAEKASPIGAAMGYLMGLFFSLKQQLIIQRSLEAAGEKAKGNDLFSSSNASKIPGGTGNIAANDPTATAVAVAAAAGVDFAADSAKLQAQMDAPLMRSNIEVNSLMKREMQNQMALQNKMRALKQQELDKYKNIYKGAAPSMVASEAVMARVVQDSTSSHMSMAAPMDNSNDVGRNFNVGVDSNVQHSHQQEHRPMASNNTVPATQGAGEMAGTDMTDRTSTADHGQTRDGNNNLLGIDNSEDFWHTDVVDDQLFEFLMNS